MLIEKEEPKHKIYKISSVKLHTPGRKKKIPCTQLNILQCGISQVFLVT